MRGFKKIDWLNHFLEFIVVIIGILLAFQLNTCSEEKEQAKLIDRHITNITEETRFNKTNLEKTIAESKQLKQTVDSIMTLLDSDGPLWNINMLSLQALRLNYAYYKQNAYNSLKQSGDIRFIDDLNLRDDIITLYEYFNWARALDDATRDTYLDNFQPYVMNNFDMRRATLQDREKYHNQVYKNILTSYSYMMQFRLQRQEELLQRMTDFIEKHGKNSY
ncbi:hypothetical protein [Luteirhabdus pelagi]|uniref:hypothetical protein n=1 Tax=Luteirhabdus pelagi TaxID=2792783 RepID=UPI0019398479|nr:hypothetical protein [Luteirhabdus pelagi]